MIPCILSKSWMNNTVERTPKLHVTELRMSPLIQYKTFYSMNYYIVELSLQKTMLNQQELKELMYEVLLREYLIVIDLSLQYNVNKAT